MEFYNDSKKLSTRGTLTVDISGLKGYYHFAAEVHGSIECSPIWEDHYFGRAKITGIILK